MYRALTTPELVKRWWSGERGKVTIAEIDLRVGGTWRYVMIAQGGSRSRSTASSARSCANERIVCTEVFEGMPEGGGPRHAHFTEVDGARRSRSSWSTEQEHRDMNIDSGMEGGMQEALDLLERVAISLQ